MGGGGEAQRETHHGGPSPTEKEGCGQRRKGHGRERGGMGSVRVRGISLSGSSELWRLR